MTTAPAGTGIPIEGLTDQEEIHFPMAGPQSNAHTRTTAGTPTSGVIHVRTRLTADFTVIANALAQRPGSAVTVGVAVYILSLPDGAPVSIAALCGHFTEGEILISRALRELEEAGYLERRRERCAGGLIRTRTYFHDVPVRGLPDPPTPTPPRPRRSPAKAAPSRVVPTQAEPVQAADRTPGQTRVPEAASGNTAAPVLGGPVAPVPSGVADAEAPATVPAAVLPPPRPASSPPSLAEADPHAVVILSSLRIADPRLVLSRREVADLAPVVAEWLAAGVGPAQITELLTAGLPDRFRARPARILAFRLRELPLALPARSAPPRKPVVLPWQTCDGGCERAFRAAEPGCCRDCRARDETSLTTAPGKDLNVAC